MSNFDVKIQIHIWKSMTPTKRKVILAGIAGTFKRDIFGDILEIYCGNVRVDCSHFYDNQKP